MLPHSRATGVAERIFSAWNWKAAALSAVSRATLFLLANLSAGWGAAWGAFGAELAFRACTSGFYGAATQALARARPMWAAAVAAIVVIPMVSHSLEFCVHYLRGTPALGRSIALSVAFTILSTLFHLFAMRRGVLVVGADAPPITDDLRRMPRLILEFVVWPFR
jgi:hypothetical protein